MECWPERLKEGLEVMETDSGGSENTPVTTGADDGLRIQSLADVMI